MQAPARTSRTGHDRRRNSGPSPFDAPEELSLRIKFAVFEPPFHDARGIAGPRTVGCECVGKVPGHGLVQPLKALRD